MATNWMSACGSLSQSSLESYSGIARNLSERSLGIRWAGGVGVLTAVHRHGITDSVPLVGVGFAGVGGVRRHRRQQHEQREAAPARGPHRVCCGWRSGTWSHGGIGEQRVQQCGQVWSELLSPSFQRGLLRYPARWFAGERFAEASHCAEGAPERWRRQLTPALEEATYPCSGQ